VPNRTAAIGLLACCVLGSCSPADDNENDNADALAACLPEAYRDTCLADVTLDLYRTCFDGSGSCTWSESRAAGSYQLLVEWENGARFQSSGSDATIEAASGERCTLTRIDTDECEGYRYASSQRWYQYCVVREENETRIVGLHYTCDDGREATVTADELVGDALTCTMQITSPTDDCVDAEGRRLGD